jgi:WD40 repeat protein
MSARRLFSLIVMLAASAESGAAEPVARLDRFGDPLPEGAVARLGSQRLRPHQPSITGVFAPDGKLLASSGSDGIIHFWDTAMGKEVRWVQARLLGPLRAMRFSADGKSLVLAGDGGAFRVIDAVSGVERLKLDPPQHDSVLALEVSPDGKVAATLYARGTIHLRDLASGKHLHAFDGLTGNPRWQVSPAQRIALTPDGKHVALPHADGSLHLGDVTSGKEVLAFEMPPLRGTSRPKWGEPQKVAISPDGRYLAYGSLQNGAALCDLQTGKRLRQLGQMTAGITSLAFAPDSRFLAVCTHSEVCVFGLVSGKEIRRFSRPVGMDGLVAFSPDGQTLALLGNSSPILLWDVPADRLVCPLVSHRSPPSALAFLPDGKRLASAGRTDGLIVWDVAAGRDIARHRHSYPFAAGFTVSGDGSRLQYVGLDRTLHLWDPQRGAEELRPLPRRVTFNHFTASHDGRTVVGDSSAASPGLGLYDVHDPEKAGRMLVLPGATRGVLRTLFSPDSRRLVAVVSDNSVCLWDRETGGPLEEWKRERAGPALSHFEFAGDGRTLALFDGEVRIREIRR